MKKLFSFLSIVLFLSFNLNLSPQVASYTFSSHQGIYTEIAGDTVVAFSTSTITNPMNLDDVTYPSNRIPFSFRFNGVAYTNFAINTNGFITFGTTPPVAANYGPISATEVYDGAVSGFGINLIGIFGTTANRVAGSAVLSNVASFAGVVAGRLITGTGIATSTSIVSFNSGAGTITMSVGATSTGNNEIIQIAAASIVRATQGLTGNRIHTIQFKNFRRNSTAPFVIVDSAKAVIDSVTFMGEFFFNSASSGTYYIVVKHRNSLETWSNSGLVFTAGGEMDYDFTAAVSQAYGNNMILKGSKYCIYSGDINQDGTIDGSDLSLVDNASNNFLSGYVREDCNGDMFVDGSDASIADNNASNFISIARP